MERGKIAVDKPGKRRCLHVDISIRFGDLKLFKIVPILEGFLPSKILGLRAQKVVHKLSCLQHASRHVTLKFRKVTQSKVTSLLYKGH